MNQNQTTKVVKSLDELSESERERVIKTEVLSFPPDWKPADWRLLSKEQLEGRIAKAREMNGQLQVVIRLPGRDPRDLTEEAVRRA